MKFSENGEQILFPFGCVENETNLFYTQPANGILGFAPTSSNNSGFVSLAKEKGLIKNKVFSLCLARNGGYITLGDYSNKYHNGIPKFIPYYAGNMYKITLNSYQIDNSNSKIKKIPTTYYTVIDSGTTLTYLPKSLNDDFINEISNHCNKVDCHADIDTRGCFKIKKNYNKEDVLKKLPKFKFILGDGKIEMTWLPINYITVDEKYVDNICFGTYSWG